MRFFRPSLAPANFTPIYYAVNSKSIKCLQYSPNLTTLNVHCLPGVNKKNIQKNIKKKLDTAPVPYEIINKNNVIQVRGLKDISLLLSDVTKQIKSEDRAFFANLDQQAFLKDSIEDESSIVDFDDEGDFFRLTEPRTRWFCLQGLRGEGVNHTAEFVLKTLQLNNHLSQSELNQALIPLWKRINELRQYHKIQNANIDIPETVPYVFTNSR